MKKYTGIYNILQAAEEASERSKIPFISPDEKEHNRTLALVLNAMGIIVQYCGHMKCNDCIVKDYMHCDGMKADTPCNWLDNPVDMKRGWK